MLAKILFKVIIKLWKRLIIKNKVEKMWKIVEKTQQIIYNIIKKKCEFEGEKKDEKNNKNDDISNVNNANSLQCNNRKCSRINR